MYSNRRSHCRGIATLVGMKYCCSICNTHIHQVLAIPPNSSLPCHSYATYAADSRTPDADNYIWPRSTVSRSNPTPYEILQIKRNDPYTKHCYYRLVKIYHPDRDNHNTHPSDVSSLPKDIRIERYRLIVAAHEILSDPVKRKAYDTNGAGWADCINHRNPAEHSQPSQRRAGNPWTGFDSPFANATWEDWEKWYERQHGHRPRPQEPVYISNIAFVLAVLGAVIVSAVGQGFNVDGHEQFFREQADKKHEEASNYFRSRMLGAEGMVGKTGQIDRFLKQREHTGYTALEGGEGGEGVEGREDRKALPSPSSTAPADTKKDINSHANDQG